MSPIVIPSAGVAALLAEIARHGDDNVETGAMLLGGSTGGRVDIVALAGDRGIERHSDYLVISGLAIARLFDWADDRERRILAQLHSHGLAAEMSLTDERFGLTVEGFTSTIVPDFADPPADPSRWAWWTFHNGMWRSSSGALVDDSTCRTVVFDEDGVRDG